MRILLAGAAAIALVATGTHAEPGKGKGNEHGGKQHAAEKTERGGRDKASARDEKPNRRGRSEDDGKAQRSSAERRGEDRRNAGVAERRAARPESRAQRREILPAARTELRRSTDERDRRFLARDRDRSLVAGCPPGLARKNNGCLPPGLAKKRSTPPAGWNGYTYRPRLFGLTNYAAGRYLYSDGYLLRPSDDGRIAGYIPLLGGALAIGKVWPSSYESYAVPDYYVDYFDLGRPDAYRYADNVIYRIDPEDAAIASVAALLTGDDFVVGQPIPHGYDVYNVPYSFRERYRDTPDAWYRYSDGYVYRIDPETRLVAAAIDLLI